MAQGHRESAGVSLLADLGFVAVTRWKGCVKLSWDSAEVCEVGGAESRDHGYWCACCRRILFSVSDRERGEEADGSAEGSSRGAGGRHEWRLRGRLRRSGSAVPLQRRSSRGEDRSYDTRCRWEAYHRGRILSFVNVLSRETQTAVSFHPQQQAASAPATISLLKERWSEEYLDNHRIGEVHLNVHAPRASDLRWFDPRLLQRAWTLISVHSVNVSTGFCRSELQQLSWKF